MTSKESFKELIKSNIKEHGYHVTLVTSTTEPRYAYTIGLYQEFNLELVFAGGIRYMKNEVHSILKTVVKELGENQNLSLVHTQNLGSFTLSKVDKTWSEIMLLGVYDFFNVDSFKAIQIIPDKNNYTMDIPDMSKTFKPSSELVWRWLVSSDWEYSIPIHLSIVTNLDVLKGKPITEIMRWEEDEFEMFAGSGSDIEEEDIRVVPLTTILSIDNSIRDAFKLEIGKGLWREVEEMKWNDWE